MNRKELLEHATCSLCGKQIGHTHLPLFWRVTIERFGINMNAVVRQDGFSNFIGSALIADALSPIESLASPVMDAAVLTVCEKCATNTEYPIAHLAEYTNEDQS